jgi:HD-GYP domain-containing protein (c-di-GMP phosphodiesterase class II)
MTTSRPYRPGLSMEDALEEMRRCRGTQFSPYLTDIFVECIRNAEDLQDSFIESPILYGVA